MERKLKMSAKSGPNVFPGYSVRLIGPDLPGLASESRRGLVKFTLPAGSPWRMDDDPVKFGTFVPA
jgi:hypothetical protein